MPGCCCRITPACRPGPPSSWWPACSGRSRCCSAGLVGWCVRLSRAGIWKREGGMIRILAALATLLLANPAVAQDRLKVVATFSILGDVAKNVGGDRIDLTMLVGPNADAHVYSPTPTDAKKLADARLIVVNGLGFEGWIDRL